MSDDIQAAESEAERLRGVIESQAVLLDKAQQKINDSLLLVVESGRLFGNLLVAAQGVGDEAKVLTGDAWMVPSSAMARLQAALKEFEGDSGSPANKD